MKIRPHRGALADAMAEVAEIEPTKAAIAAFFNRRWTFGPAAQPWHIVVEKYGTGVDERISWDTHIVLVNGHAYGFTDGPLKELP